MGTRHLIAIMLNGEYKIAQYGQWDGYLDGQGSTILGFLQQMHTEGTQSDFVGKVAECVFVDGSRADEIFDKENWRETHPQMSRDAGSDILGYIAEGTKEFIDNIGFAGDSLFCEWAYVIDFDKNVFEVYGGFVKRDVPRPEVDRFSPDDERFAPGDNTEYGPVVMTKSFPLDALPSVGDFVKDADPE